MEKRKVSTPFDVRHINSNHATVIHVTAAHMVLKRFNDVSPMQTGGPASIDINSNHVAVTKRETVMVTFDGEMFNGPSGRHPSPGEGARTTL